MDYCNKFKENDDDVVISGISGRFPNSHNLSELSFNLYNKIDMCDDDERRFRKRKGIPQRHGKIYDLEKFDAGFFGVNQKLANATDPQTRGVLEHAYEAVYDAGINPQDIRGTNTAVFNAICEMESESIILEKGLFDGYSIVGENRGMFANRVSYSMNLRGPSYVIDSACSSSMMALDCAVRAIRNGQCEAAIVGGANLTLLSTLSLQFARLGVTAPDGFCRPFDQKASGYTRSEAISAMFLQKRKDAKRCYATILHTKVNNDGYKPEGITYPAGNVQQELLEQFYQEIDIDPSVVDYVEAHGTATQVGDPEECEAIYQVFCKNRDTPLPIGSIKSSIGHPEPVSGICSILKCLLAFETGKISPNINFDEIKKEITALKDGHLKVVNEIMDLPGPLAAASSFGFGGSNGHVLLRRNEKRKINHGIPEDVIPRLVCWSGRTEKAPALVFEEICKRPLDAEFIGLLHNCQTQTIPTNVVRGYGVFKQDADKKKKAVCLVKEIQRNSGTKRPIVWVFSGMGSQWLKMGTSLMTLPIFYESIDYCHQVLEKYGLNLKEILTSSQENIFDNILHSFVGIAAIQIAIVDILRILKLEPDYIIGHSVGELGCGYADGCLTRDEMILSAYSRGVTSLETAVILGKMAAIGLGYKDICSILPKGIEVACHNSPDSCTISGPADLITSFLKSLTNKGIFAREVPCSNIPYHSSYISSMGPKLLARLKNFLLTTKQRSSKWLSTSVPQENWNKIEAQLSSAEYYTNNLLSSVLFEETMKLLPANAITLEIAPHSLLQPILRKAMPNATHISLTQRGKEDNLSVFLSGLGKLYLEGTDMRVDLLYAPIQFPVSANTPMISPLIQGGWDHTDDFYVIKAENERMEDGAEQNFNIHVANKDFRYLTGHKIDGRILYPAAGYLCIVWEGFCSMTGTGKYFMDTPVEFNDVKFLQASNVTKDRDLKFNVVIHYVTGRFELTESGSALVTGYIKSMDTYNPVNIKKPEEDAIILKTSDFYKELKLRGYHYDGEFRSVLEARSDGLAGKIRWNDNFITFIDCMLQIAIVGFDSRSLMIPTRMESVKIEPELFCKSVKLRNGETDARYAKVICSKPLKIIQAEGIEIHGLRANTIQRRRPTSDPILESYTFLPYVKPKINNEKTAMRVFVQIGLENLGSMKIKGAELVQSQGEPLIQYLKQTLDDTPSVTYDLTLLSKEKDLNLTGITVETTKTLSGVSGCDFLIVSNYCENEEKLLKAAVSCKDRAFVISVENLDLDITNLQLPDVFHVVSTVQLEDKILILLQHKKEEKKATTFIKISQFDKEYNWLQELRLAIKFGKSCLVVQGEPQSGIIGFINCLTKEIKNDVACVFIDDPTAPEFDPSLPLYMKQLEKNLVINVYRNGCWGSYRHLLLALKYHEVAHEDHCYANALINGNLSSLTWLEGSIDVRNDDVAKVHFASLNFRDVMIATGRLDLKFLYNRLEQSCIIGFEYSGVLKNGKRVMGMTKRGAVSTHVKPLDTFTWEVPANWTLEEAATVPCVYCTVYDAFFNKVKIESGKKVLIHAGTGGVGLAAIRVALVYGLQVFTTVSTPEKKQYLLDNFPGLKSSHIGNSRDTSFYEMIMQETDGYGVDYVLNSLADDKLIASIKCLARYGNFIEIGKYDILTDTKIGLGHFEKNITFHTVMLDSQLNEGVITTMHGLKDVFENDLKNGVIIPLKRTVFEAREVEQAVRYLASGKHMGKVLLKVRNDESDTQSVPISVLPQVYCKPDMSYIIIGGLGGFGLELADWLVLRGCKFLVLSSSKGISKHYQEYRINLWKSYGIRVLVSTADITSHIGCIQLIECALQLAPVAAIFNLAVLLRDELFENQDAQKFKETLSVKAVATKYLDESSRELCPMLEHFIVFSSISCGRGNIGQTNYGMANSIMERIIERRVADGYPGKAIQWGAVGEVGLVADMAENKIDMKIGGTLQQRISSCLQVLDTLLTCPDPIVGSMVVAEKSLVSKDLMDTVLNIIGIKDAKSVSMDQKLYELGMDSLMAVEIKQTIERDYDIVLPPQELRTLTFGRLLELSSKKPSGHQTVNKEVSMTLLFRNFGDEKDSDQVVLTLKSMCEQENKNNGILIVPGIEGVAGSVWHQFASKINSPVCMLQLKNTNQATTVEEITNLVINDVMQNYVKDSKTFFIIGYSFGALVALDIVKRLEDSGLTGKLALLDGAPLWAHKVSNIALPESTEDKMVSIQKTLTAIMMMNLGLEKSMLDSFTENPWDDVMNKIFEALSGESLCSKEHYSKIIQGIFSRYKIATEIDVDNFIKVNSDIILVRSVEPLLSEIEEDYQLKNCTSKNVTTKFVEGNHSTMLDNPELADIINETNSVK